MPLATLSDCIRAELAAVEERFAADLDSPLPCVQALVKHVGRFRGKMLRPSLLLLAGKACGKLTDEHITLGTVVEMLHMASLVHDDVLDEAELRRKGATINHLQGNEAAVMLGDYLFSHAFHLCSGLDSQYASRLIGRTATEICEGELLQIDNRQHYELDEPTYFQIITRKTASLCAVSCLLGARYAGADALRTKQLESFGLSMGIAFQIQDDILDLVGDVRCVGKTLGTDIEKGKMTLPMIHFMRSAPAEHRQLLRSLLAEGNGDRVERIRNLLAPSESIHHAEHRARQHVERATRAIANLPDTEAKRLLEAMAEFVVSRET